MVLFQRLYLLIFVIFIINDSLEKRNNLDSKFVNSGR